MVKSITNESVLAFEQHLLRLERAPGTIAKYLHDVRAFARWLGGSPILPDSTAGWKAHLLVRGYAPSSVNAMLASLNAFFRFAGWTDCRAHFVRIQRRVFRDASRELSREEYERLLRAAKSGGDERLALVLETLCATGIRVSELRFVTLEAAHAGRAEVSLKGKVRTIVLPGKLCRKLLRYSARRAIRSGEIFVTRSGRSLSRGQIWAALKGLCAAADVAPTKVFPHNLRHLFATTFYRVSRDIVRLADVLGHSSIETTRIYLATSGREFAAMLDRLGLVS